MTSNRLPTPVLALIVPVIAVLAAVITLNVTSEDRASSASGAGAATSGTGIVIKDFDFAPKTLQVPAGTEVKVTNADGAAHTVTADDGGFDTGDLDGGRSATITIDAPGKYRYFCDIHNYMTGVIEAS
jgi:plastocyanin